jgi:hypothetical protein
MLKIMWLSDADLVLVGDISINCLLYADDLVLLSSSPCGLQTCFDTLYEFCSCWKLEVNNSNSKVLIFNSNGKSFLNHCMYKKGVVIFLFSPNG